MKQKTALLAILVASVLAGAFFSDHGRPAAATPAPQAATSPASGATGASVAGAKITGVLMDYDSKKPVTDATVRLYLMKGKADKEGWAPVDDAKIATKVTTTGAFSLAGVKPGTYMLMVEKDRVLPASVRDEDAKAVSVVVTTQASVDIGRVWVQLRQQ